MGLAVLKTPALLMITSKVSCQFHECKDDVKQHSPHYDGIEILPSDALIAKCNATKGSVLNLKPPVAHEFIKLIVMQGEQLILESLLMTHIHFVLILLVI